VGCDTNILQCLSYIGKRGSFSLGRRIVPSLHRVKSTVLTAVGIDWDGDWARYLSSTVTQVAAPLSRETSPGRVKADHGLEVRRTACLAYILWDIGVFMLLLCPYRRERVCIAGTQNAITVHVEIVPWWYVPVKVGIKVE
jgi:hypothetical protein